jgi:hypothetical protein
VQSALGTRKTWDKYRQTVRKPQAKRRLKIEKVVGYVLKQVLEKETVRWMELAEDLIQRFTSVMTVSIKVTVPELRQTSTAFIKP